MNFKLEYKSKLIPIAIYSGLEKPNNIEHEGINFTEYYEDNPHDGGHYQIIVSKEVDRESNTIDGQAEEIAKVCRKINLYSIYALGRPLNMVSSGLFNWNFGITLGGHADGWETNKGEVTFSSSFGLSRLTVGMEKSPLKDLVILIQNDDQFTVEDMEIIRLHNNALTAINNTGFVIISKALEILKPSFEKKRLKDELKFLPTAIKKKFKDKDIGWLYEISNRRLETRHAIKDKQKGTLHRQLSAQEKSDFALLAHLLISHYIRKKVGLVSIDINY